MTRAAFRTGLLTALLMLAPALSEASIFESFGPQALPLTAEDFKLMDQADGALTTDAALPLDSSRSWRNSTSGHSGTVTLLKRFEYMYQGNRLTCRKLAYEFSFASVADQYRYVLNRCQVADGSWKLLSVDASDGQRPQGQ
jgi:surface antigen